MDHTANVITLELRRTLRELRRARLWRIFGYLGAASFTPMIVELPPDPIDIEWLRWAGPLTKHYKDAVYSSDRSQVRPEEY